MNHRACSSERISRPHLPPALQTCWDIYRTVTAYAERNLEVLLFQRFLEEEYTLDQLSFFLSASPRGQSHPPSARPHHPAWALPKTPQPSPGGRLCCLSGPCSVTPEFGRSLAPAACSGFKRKLDPRTREWLSP